MIRMNQGEIYIKEDADKWFDRNTGTSHNCFTEYLLKLFSRISLSQFSIAEFGVGRANNIRFLSHYAKTIHGYDGSAKSIEAIKSLRRDNPGIDGKRVNLGSSFSTLDQYNLIIFGFFTYMINDQEFDVLLSNTENALNKQNGYVYIYDFITQKNSMKTDAHNGELNVYKRNLNYYVNKFQEYTLIDFRLWDNRHLSNYILTERISRIDEEIDSDDYNHTFSALFKRNT